MLRLAVLCCLLACLLAAAGCSSVEPPAADEAAAPPFAGNESRAATGNGHLIPDPSLREFEQDYSTAEEEVADPIRGFNYAMFRFNNGFYYYFLKPVGKGWDKVMPDPVERGVDNFLTNLRFPVRFVASLAQAKGCKSAVEASRFGINTTLGIAGIFDPADGWFEIAPPPAEDFDQTLAVWGMGPGGYFVFPIMGPSSFRGIGGFLLDTPLDPVTYTIAGPAVAVVEGVNKQALAPRKGYENLMETAVDPYVALRSAYFQNFEKRVAE